MLERRLVADGDPRPLVVFDPREDSINGDREDHHRTDRDRAMRAAASLCITLARAGGCDLLVPGARRALTIDPALRGWPEAHTWIALADPQKGIVAPAHLRGGLVVWVTAGRGIPGSLRGLDPGSVMVTPRGSPRSAVFRVAGCFAYPAVSPGRSAPQRSAAA